MEYSIILIIVLIFSIVIHEIAHGSVAYSLGDDTAFQKGRLSLNPLVHIDPIGSLLIPGVLLLMNSSFLFGWAKPVPVDFSRIRDPWGELKVSFAGPLVNLFIAFIFCLFIRFSLLPSLDPIFYLIAFMNIILAMFNLLPIYPLDGSHILFNLLPNAHEFKKFMINYGIFIFFFFLFVFPSTGWMIDVARYLISLFTGVSA